DVLVHVVHPRDAAEHALIDEREVLAGREIEADTVVLGVGAVVPAAEENEATRQAEVKIERGAGIERGEQVLTVPVRPVERTALEAAPGLRARNTSEDRDRADRDGIDYLVQRVLLEIAPKVLDVGQLGHGQRS